MFPIYLDCHYYPRTSNFPNFKAHINEILIRFLLSCTGSTKGDLSKSGTISNIGFSSVIIPFTLCEDIFNFNGRFENNVTRSYFDRLQKGKTL